jgi:hypothetical protein
MCMAIFGAGATAHKIHNTMFLDQSTRPYTCAKILQRFRFAQTPEGVT